MSLITSSAINFSAILLQFNKPLMFLSDDNDSPIENVIVIVIAIVKAGRA